MAQLAASIVSHDAEFKREISRLLRAGGVPVGIIESMDAAPDRPELVYARKMAK